VLAPLCAVELALDFVVLALYDVTVMCDDSASMKVRQHFPVHSVDVSSMRGQIRA
jgi:hypothetical protein